MFGGLGLGLRLGLGLGLGMGNYGQSDNSSIELMFLYANRR